MDNDINKILKKLSSYKYDKCRRKYQKKIFGICEGEPITIKGLISAILIVINIKEKA